MNKINNYQIFNKITNMQERLTKEIENLKFESREYKLIINLERIGGECIICKTEWKKIKVFNEYADFYYYAPVCNCYPKCPKCKRSLHREYIRWSGNVSKCLSCGYNLQEKKNEQLKQYMREHIYGV